MKCPHCKGSGDLPAYGSIGATLRRLRHARGLTLHDVSERVPGVAWSTLSKIETGKAKRAPFAVIEALAAFYGITLDELRQAEAPQ